MVIQDEMFESVDSTIEEFDLVINHLLQSNEGRALLKSAIETEGREFALENFGCLSLGKIKDLKEQLY